MPMKPDDKVRCSFCGKSSKQVRKMIAGLNNTYICDECVELGQEIFDEEMGKDQEGTDVTDLHLLKPREIKDFLESEKIGKIFIDKRPNGMILIETTETKKYQNRVCKKAT